LHLHLDTAHAFLQRATLLGSSWSTVESASLRRSGIRTCQGAQTLPTPASSVPCLIDTISWPMDSRSRPSFFAVMVQGRAEEQSILTRTVATERNRRVDMSVVRPPNFQFFFNSFQKNLYFLNDWVGFDILQKSFSDSLRRQIGGVAKTVR